MAKCKKPLLPHPLCDQLLDPEAASVDMLGERAPRRRDLPNWLKENPDYEVEGDMLEVGVPVTT